MSLLNTNSKELYKKTNSNVDKDLIRLREHIRKKTLNAQRSSRDYFLTRKRLKLKNEDEVQDFISAEEDHLNVEAAAKGLRQKSAKDEEWLKFLIGALTRSESHSREFLSLDGLNSLKRCFHSTNPIVVRSAAWCVVNMSASSVDTVDQATKLSPYLIQFLRSSDSEIQELSAWALANMCADSKTTTDMFVNQGCLPSLVELLSEKNCLDINRTKSVVFTLINLTQSDLHSIKLLGDYNFTSILENMFKELDSETLLLMDVGWLVDTIYSRVETLKEFPEDCCKIACILLNFFSSLSRIKHEEKCLRPMFHCLANLIGLNVALPKMLSRLQVTSPGLLFCLRRTDILLLTEALRSVANFMVDPSCRVFLVFQLPVLSAILNLCQHEHIEVASKALYVLDMASQTSTFVDEYLVHSGVVQVLTLLITLHIELAKQVFQILNRILLSQNSEDNQLESTDLSVLEQRISSVSQHSTNFTDKIKLILSDPHNLNVNTP